MSDWSDLWFDLEDITIEEEVRTSTVHQTYHIIKMERIIKLDVFPSFVLAACE